MKRNFGIDTIKVIAAMFVIAVHHFSHIGFYNYSYNNGITMIISTSIYLVFLSGVPLFLITTGFLLSSRTPNIAHFKKIFWFLLEFTLIIIIGTLISTLYFKTFSTQHWYNQILKNIKDPVYYVGLYFSLYLVSPYINSVFKSLNDKNKELIFIIILVFTISFPSLINKLFDISFFDTRPTVIWSVLYYSIGVYIRRNEPTYPKFILVFFISIISLVYGLLMNYFLLELKYTHYFGYYQNFFLVMITSLIFLVFYNLNITQTWLTTILKYLSTNTLSFYLIGLIISDSIAMNYVDLSNTLYLDILTTPKKVFLSMLVTLPISLVVRVSFTSIQQLINISRNKF